MDDSRFIDTFFPSNPHLDLFYNVKRDTHRQNVHILLQDSWQCNPSTTLKIIFYLRDCRGGAGHKALFYIALKWLITNHVQEFQANISNIPHYGSFKDLLQFLDTTESKNVLKYLAEQLKKDKALLGTDEAQIISRAGKWAPSQGGHHDQKYQAVAKLCGLLGVNKATYRKEYLVPLRQHIGIVEQQMSAQQWQDIDFSKLTAVNRKFYEKAWERHRETDYKKFMKQSRNFQIGTDYPYQMLIPYLVKGTEIDADVEQKWTAHIEKVRNQWIMGNILTMVDTSKNMHISCKARAIYMSLLTTNFNTEHFNNKCISFSTNPQFIYIKGKTLQKQLRTIIDAPAQDTVNIEYAFNMILRFAARLKVGAKNMPEMLIIFANRPFAEVCVQNGKNGENVKQSTTKQPQEQTNTQIIEKRIIEKRTTVRKSSNKQITNKQITNKQITNKQTTEKQYTADQSKKTSKEQTTPKQSTKYMNPKQSTKQTTPKQLKEQKNHKKTNHKIDFAAIDKKYNVAGYKRPILVYWNLSGSVVHFSWHAGVPDTLLINGCNSKLVELFEEGQGITPLKYMLKIIEGERYAQLKVAFGEKK